MTKEELIEKYRDINVDGGFDWWECIEFDLQEYLDEQGFRLDQMSFSGFWSQGDGACFTGHVHDWSKFCDKVPQFVADFPNTAIFLQDEGGSYTITHRDRYYHAMSTSHELQDADIEWVTDSIETDIANERGDMAELPMRLAIYKAAMQEEGVEQWLTEYFRGLMKDLYRNLEAEYEHLTSDEVVWDTIVANELNKEVGDDGSEAYATNV
jgi:hypothetical protein